VTTRRPRSTRSRPSGRTPAPLPAPVAVLTLVAALTACSSDGGSGPAPTVTVTDPGSTTPGSASAKPTATSDVQGRRFDLGTVIKVSTVAGVLVVELDRWTLPGTTDSKIARDGLPTEPHEGPLYTNQNTQKTYTAPVADSARVVINRCVRSAGNPLGMTSAQQDAVGWLRSADPAAVLLVTYDDAGQIIRLDTEARC
jgi:hypothetical protein